MGHVRPYQAEIPDKIVLHPATLEQAAAGLRQTWKSLADFVPPVTVHV